MYSMICVEWATDHYEDLREKTIVTCSFPVTLKICSTIVQCYVYTKLEVSMALLFWQNQRHETDRRMDGWGATLNAAWSTGRAA